MKVCVGVRVIWVRIQIRIGNVVKGGLGLGLSSELRFGLQIGLGL